MCEDCESIINKYKEIIKTQEKRIAMLYENLERAYANRFDPVLIEMAWFRIKKEKLDEQERDNGN